VVEAIVVHGGAGTWRNTPSVESALSAIKHCTELGWGILRGGGSSLDAVVEAVKCMEDSGYFNAGYGSALNLLGERELDAGLMTSAGIVGAVAAVKFTKNPVLLARLVAEKTPHVILAGENADRFALIHGLPPLPPPPKHVVDKYRELLKRVFEGRKVNGYYAALREFVDKSAAYSRLVRELLELHGTVGAAAVDRGGVLAAATSTGGLALKLPGRVGDTPVPGAGFYATSRIACSATGIGEKVLRVMPCLRLDLEYSSVGGDLERALRRVVEYIECTVGTNTLGFVGVDATGRVFYAYNTEAMIIGYTRNGSVKVSLRPEPKAAVIDVAEHTQR